MNNLFAFHKISVRESFVIIDDDTGKNYEQIDGVVEIKNKLTLVEMKWTQNAIGANEITRFMGRLFLRDNVDGIFISYSSYTETGIKQLKKP